MNGADYARFLIATYYHREELELPHWGWRTNFQMATRPCDCNQKKANSGLSSCEDCRLVQIGIWILPEEVGPM